MEHNQKGLSEVEVQSKEWKGSDNENEVSRKASPHGGEWNNVEWIMDIYMDIGGGVSTTHNHTVLLV